MGCSGFNLKPPPSLRQLKSGLAACKCGKSDLVGIIRRLGKCIDCAKKDIDALSRLRESITKAVEDSNS